MEGGEPTPQARSASHVRETRLNQAVLCVRGVICCRTARNFKAGTSRNDTDFVNPKGFASDVSVAGTVAQRARRSQDAKLMDVAGAITHYYTRVNSRSSRACDCRVIPRHGRTPLK